MNGHSGIEQSKREANQRMLAGLLAQRNLGFFNRMAARAEQRLARWQVYWATQSRRGRQALWRKLAPAAVGVSLLSALVLVDAPVSALSITVDNGEVAIAVNGLCSLSEAIENANDTTTGQPHIDCAVGDPSGADTINLPVAGSFTLTSVYVNYHGDIGLPPIDGNVTIEGNGATIARSGGAPNFTIMATALTGVLTLNDITLTGGKGSVPGAGIPYGGGIFNEGTLYLNDSTLSGNEGVFGAAIFNRGDAEINNSILDDNAAVPVGLWDSRGGAIYNWGGDVRIYDSEVTDNSASGYAGALMNTYKGVVGGNLLIETSTISGNSAKDGGAIANALSQVTIYDSSLTSNDATLTDGGAIDNYGTMVINGSTLSGNSAARNGGGIYNSKTLTVVNSTVSGNNALDGGGVHTARVGSAVTFRNVTLTGNSAGDDGGGLFNQNSTVTLQRSILSGNTAVQFGPELYNNATIIANQFNIFGKSGGSGAFNLTPGATDIVPSVAVASILNTTLADNGGPTMTHALPAGSPAVDAAPSADCTSAPISGVDQRDLPRNVNGKGGVTANECDIGAFERQEPAPASPSLYVSPTTAGTVGGVATTPQDILEYDQTTSTWAMHFDGSDVGVVKIISSFAHLPDGDLLLVFKANQVIAGVGTFTPWDVARFTPTSLGSTTAGAFSWYIDGSDPNVGLTTTAEKIDALDVLADGRVLVSTAGTLAVPKPGGVLKSQDEDLTAFTPTQTGANTMGSWAPYFNGTAITGLGAEDVVGAHVDEATGDRYLSILGAFNVGGVSGNGKDILKLTPSGGGYTVTRFWRGPLNGFNLNIGGMELSD